MCAFLGEARTGTVSVTRTGDRDLRRGSTVAGRNGNAGGGVRRDIDRIFEGGAGKLFAVLYWLPVVGDTVQYNGSKLLAVRVGEGGGYDIGHGSCEVIVLGPSDGR